MWDTKKLGAVLELEYGKGLPKRDRNNEGNYPVYGSNGIVGYHDDYLIDFPCLIVGRKGAAGEVHISENKCWPIDTTYYVKAPEDWNLRFLFYLLKSLMLQQHDRSTAIPGLNRNDAYDLEIPTPPLPTQHRIVEKIEELFSELDNGVEDLKKAQKQLKTYRQAVLKDAFEGKLTKEWRRQQDDLPTPDELLQQIKAERNAHRQCQIAEWEKEVEQWEKDGEPGRKPRKPRKVNKVEPINEKKLNKLAELPNNWLWMKLGRVIVQPKYGTSEKCDYDFEGYGVLRIPNIGKGKIDSDDMKYAPLEEDEASKYALQEGDILTIRSNGSIDLVGKCALVRKPDTKFLHAGYLIRLRPYEVVADSSFLLNVLSSISLRNQIESKAKSTSGVNNINSGELQDLIIPICGVNEQVQIVKEIESRLSVVDQLEQTIKENLQKAEALRQSILKKVFGGELVD